MSYRPNDGTTGPMLPKITPASAVGMVVFDASGNLGSCLMSEYLTWLASQGADDANIATGSGLLSGDQVVTLRNGVLTALPQSILGSGSGGGTAVPTNTAVPTISGTAQAGQTLTSTQGTWTGSPTSYAYAWKRAGTAISGANSSSYVPVSADVGNTLTCTVTASNAGGPGTPATSAATASVVAAAQAATAYAISTASNGSAGIPQTVTVTANGALSSSVVVTLSDGASGTFGGTVTLTSGSTSGMTSYTPASAGTKSITGTNSGTLTNPSAVTVTVAAASGRPAMALSGAQFETAAPIGGAASLKGGAGTGTATLTIPGNGQSGNQANAAIYFRFQSKGGTALSSGSPFLTLGIPNGGGTTVMAFSFSGNSLVVTYGSATQSFAARDGAVHELTLAESSYNANTYLDVFFDGARTRMADGIAGYLIAGNATLTYSGANLAAGDLLDDIEVRSGDHTGSGSTAPVRSTPIAAVSDTLGLYQFEAQTGASS